MASLESLLKEAAEREREKVEATIFLVETFGSPFLPDLTAIRKKYEITLETLKAIQS